MFKFVENKNMLQIGSMVFIILLSLILLIQDIGNIITHPAMPMLYVQAIITLALLVLGALSLFLQKNYKIFATIGYVILICYSIFNIINISSKLVDSPNLVFIRYGNISIYIIIAIISLIITWALKPKVVNISYEEQLSYGVICGFIFYYATQCLSALFYMIFVPAAMNGFIFPFIMYLLTIILLVFSIYKNKVKVGLYTIVVIEAFTVLTNSSLLVMYMHRDISTVDVWSQLILNICSIILGCVLIGITKIKKTEFLNYKAQVANSTTPFVPYNTGQNNAVNNNQVQSPYMTDTQQPANMNNYPQPNMNNWQQANMSNYQQQNMNNYQQSNINTTQSQNSESDGSNFNQDYN